MTLPFNKSDIKGSIILSIIILFFLTAKHFYFDFYSVRNQIQFDDKTLQDQYQKFVQEQRKNLNNITVEELADIGIYKNVAATVIRYREQLGGFISSGQLHEVKNLHEQDLALLEEFTFVEEKFQPRKLKINEAEFRELLRHPYLDFEDVKNICNLRRKMKIRNAGMLKEILSGEKIKKIERYLDFS